MPEAEPFGYTIGKDARYGWRASTDILLDDNGLVLSVTTSKLFKGDLCTSATVHHVEGGFKTHMMYQDYSHTALCSKVKCTESAVVKQHEAVLATLNEVILPAVKKQYNIGEQNAQA